MKTAKRQQITTKDIILFLLFLIANASVLFAQNDALKILPNGNVGVGATNPNEKLQVAGNIKSEGRIKDKTGNVVPVGSIMAFAGAQAPDGWLLCDGKSYPVSGDKNDLFNVISTTYGGGNGQFNVPDLRQTFVMGANPANGNEQLGKKGEADRHTHSINPPGQSFKTSDDGAHYHRFNPNWYKRNFGSGGYSGIDTDGTDIKNQTTESVPNHSHSVYVALPAFTSGEYTGQNRPKWMALNYIIKY
ncbi:tail fiber protein [Flavobacterium supellecticarium]|uniref:Tail fiber protein n=1 Tax=Flavobacterium supellecticarium TaxID=2565924 RepID=A0A4S4A0S5_9FLAO|nr:tail fiber protein [Flavobacterium supellecticarium]THF51772.1 tail fiber protein [Flavobacterium supellecticarium]